jgi:hypothetical protein
MAGDDTLRYNTRTLAVGTGVWSPSLKPSSNITEDSSGRNNQGKKKEGEDAPPVVWTPKSAGASPTTERKEFRPVNFESPTLSRKNKSDTITPVPVRPADVSCNCTQMNSNLQIGMQSLLENFSLPFV